VGFSDLAEVVTAEGAWDSEVVWLSCEWLVDGLSPTWAQSALWQRASGRYAARLEARLRERGA